MENTVSMKDHKFNVMFSVPITDLNLVCEEMENDPYLKQFNSKINLTPTAKEGFYDLTITMPADGHGGTLGSSIGLFISEKQSTGQWFKIPSEDEYTLQ